MTPAMMLLLAGLSGTLNGHITANGPVTATTTICLPPEPSSPPIETNAQLGARQNNGRPDEAK